MNLIEDPAVAHDEAVREWVARQTVDCLNCGGRLFLQQASGKWRHVRGDRLGPTRCQPGSATEADPAINTDGQTRIHLGGDT